MNSLIRLMMNRPGEQIDLKEIQERIHVGDWVRATYSTEVSEYIILGRVRPSPFSDALRVGPSDLTEWDGQTFRNLVSVELVAPEGTW